ncbi:MAG: glutamate--cysteine ligase [Buchnera aphidicola (Eriosoma harunire)]
MITNISNNLKWLEENSNELNNILRGIERETLRIDIHGKLSLTPFPKFIGSPLTNRWITTDFSESSLEFITPSSNNINYLINFLNDSYHFITKYIDNERMWPFSMPNLLNYEPNIPIAQYGNSKLGKKKSLYRIGLKNRYGSAMQAISGVHYNFSLPSNFWKLWNKKNNITKKNTSNEYLKIIRNYHRFGWLIPYLFGSSPMISPYFIKKQNNIHYLKKNNKGDFYAPWSTSLRLSNLGYQNQSKLQLNMTFNNIKEYLFYLNYALHTTSPKFKKIGLKNKQGEYNQINTNILQIENEFYTAVKPKRILNPGESYLTSLYKKGIQYIEIRSLDVNPFTPIGINKQQILLLDVFLIWCLMLESPIMTKNELKITYENWNRVIFEGRKPKQHIILYNEYKQFPLATISNLIFQDLLLIANILDKNCNSKQYYLVCIELMKSIENPDLTYSAQILEKTLHQGIHKSGIDLANQYYYQFKNKLLNKSSEKIFSQECNQSLIKQQKIENNSLL